MLMLDPAARAGLWQKLIDIIEDHSARIAEHRVTAELDPAEIRAALARVDFSKPMDPIAALEFAAENLWRYQTHTTHPRYFGLFNPAPTTMGIAADALVAAFNPQLAAWSHSPFAAEAEQHVIRALGKLAGYDESEAGGTFASGGAEANHTALLLALGNTFPAYAVHGTRSFPDPPTFYASSECHHSFQKAARMTGVGAQSLREVLVDDSLRMDVEALENLIRLDRARGCEPFLIIATAGTTSAGVVDPIAAIGEIARRERIWFHVDAAWGGAALLDDELRPHLAGIELADSITFDAHKWLSAPMGAGILLTRRPEMLERCFHTGNDYMPKEAAGLPVVDPYQTSMQWSRRFIGLKVFLSLAVAGWEGYAAAVRHMTRMGGLLREQLEAGGWEIVNRTPLPLVCFADRNGADAERIAMDVVSSGEAWISTVMLSGGRRVLRACVTNYNTREEDIRGLCGTLHRARARCSR